MLNYNKNEFTKILKVKVHKNQIWYVIKYQITKLIIKNSILFEVKNKFANNLTFNLMINKIKKLIKLRFYKS